MVRIKKGGQCAKSKMKTLMKNKWNKSLKSIIKKLVTSDLIDSTGRTLLHLAAEHNNFEVIPFLIEKGYSVDAKDSSGTTPLMVAVSSHSYDSIQCLLEFKADVFTTDINGNYALRMMSKMDRYTPLTLRSFLSRLKIIGKSIKEIADKLSDAAFPLDFVVILKNPELTKIILQKEKPISRIESYRSMLHAFMCLDVGNILVLLRYGQARTERGFFFFKFFNKSAKSSDPSRWGCTSVLVQKCVEWGMINRDTIGFYERLFEKSQKIPLKVFFDYRLDYHIKKRLNYDCKVHVFGNRNVDVFEILDESKFDVHVRGRSGLTALHLAVEYAVVRNVKYLLENGADPNSVNEQGITPLFMCLVQWESPYENESVECLRLLLHHGADLQKCDEDGLNFFDFHEASETRMPVMEVLLAHLALHEAFNGTIAQSIYDSILIDCLLQNCLEESRRQIEEMKNFKICDALTLFSVLSKKPEKLARIVGAQDQESIAALMKSESVQKLYYYYSLNERLQHAAFISHCRNNAAQVIAENVQMLQCNTLVIEKIMSYLTLDDLLVFETKPRLL